MSAGRHVPSFWDLDSFSCSVARMPSVMGWIVVLKFKCWALTSFPYPLCDHVWRWGVFRKQLRLNGIIRGGPWPNRTVMFWREEERGTSRSLCQVRTAKEQPSTIPKTIHRASPCRHPGSRPPELWEKLYLLFVRAAQLAETPSDQHLGPCSCFPAFLVVGGRAGRWRTGPPEEVGVYGWNDITVGAPVPSLYKGQSWGSQGRCLITLEKRGRSHHHKVIKSRTSEPGTHKNTSNV